MLCKIQTLTWYYGLVMHVVTISLLWVRYGVNMPAILSYYGVKEPLT
jgi:hypothetical protein